MATVTHHIRSEYDPEVDKARLLRETGQPPEDNDDDDLWHTESSSAGFHKSNRATNPPKFVPALLSYDEWGSSATLTPAPEHTLTTSRPTHGDVASWYRSLGRQRANPTHQQHQPPSSNSHTARHRTPEATPDPPSSSPSPIITLASPAHVTSTPSSSTGLAQRRQHRGRRDWFISRAISQSQSQSASASAPPTPGPSSATAGSSSTVADILSRHPPSAQPFRPPVFLHLGPSNKGWAMLQNQGWSEGEGLGAGGRSRNDDARARTTTASLQTGMEKSEKRPRLDSPSSAAPAHAPSPPPSQEQQRQMAAEEEQEMEILVDDDDDDPIIEVRKKPRVAVIDLTQSDTEDEEEEVHDDNDDNDVSDENESENENDGDSLAPAPAPASSDDDDDDPRAAQTAPLTPLPTILKSDRLGIGLKAKTQQPAGRAYRAPVKRVTHSAAALAAHHQAAEDMRRAQQRFGKGRRAFARAERLERESRQHMMAYISEP